MNAYVDRAATTASNLLRLVRDATGLLIERTFFRNDSATLGGDHKPIETLADLWERMGDVYGEDTLQWAIYIAVTLLALVVGKLLFDAVRIFTSASDVDKTLDELKKNRKQKKTVKAAQPKNANEVEAPAVPRVGEPVVSVVAAPSAEEIALVADISRTFQSATTPSSSLRGPPIASLLQTKEPHKKNFKGSSKGSVFPSHIGVLAVSPGQQYLLVSCRQTKDARVYPQGKVATFMSKGTELAQAANFFLPLGRVLAPVLNLEANADTGVAPVDISIAAFQHSSPLGGSSFVNGTSASHAVAAAAKDHIDLVDDSNEFVVVGESTKDVYVILRLFRETKPGSRFAEVRAEVMWKYQRGGNLPVWQCDCLGLYSSFATHLDVPVAPSAGESVRHGVRPSMPISPTTMGNVLVFFNKKEGAVSAIHRDAPSSVSQPQKFGVGRGTCIVPSDPFVLYAGDFLSEARVSQLLINRHPTAGSTSRHSWFSVDRLYSLHSSLSDRSSGHSPMVLKRADTSSRSVVVGMAMVQPHLPPDRLHDAGMHTPSFVVTVDDAGMVCVYDVEAAGLPDSKKGDRNPYRCYFGQGSSESAHLSTSQLNHNPKVAVAQLQLPSLKGYGASSRFGIDSVAAAVIANPPTAGTGHLSFRLVIALANASERRVTLIASSAPSSGSSDALGLVVLAQWSHLHPRYTSTGEDNCIKGLVFVQGGRGIATVGDDDGEGIALRVVPGVDLS